MTNSKKMTFVLVHGAWHGGWCYQRTARILRERGHDVYAPSLTGLADRSHLIHYPVDLSTHVLDIVNLITWEGLENVVLAGHSYGGMVITGVADRIPERIAGLVYLDALLPQNGQSAAMLLDANARQGDAGTASSLSETVKSHRAESSATLPPVPAATFNLSAADCELVDRLCTPHPLATFLEQPQLTGDLSMIGHKIFVIATDWGSGTKPTRACFDALPDKEGWTLLEVPYGHDLMLDAPEALADILVSAA